MYLLRVGLCEKSYFWAEILEQPSFAIIHHTSSKPPVFQRSAFQTLCPRSLFFMCFFPYWKHLSFCSFSFGWIVTVREFSPRISVWFLSL